MAFVKVCSVAQLPPDCAAEVDVAGNPVALCRTADGQFRAIGGICPHLGAPLGFGNMNGDNVACPWHAWEFSTLTGQLDFNPEIHVPVYAVRVEDNDVLVDVS